MLREMGREKVRERKDAWEWGMREKGRKIGDGEDTRRLNR